MATTTSNKTPDNPGATVTHYQEKADEVTRLIEGARAAIPSIDVPTDMALSTPVAGVKDAFLATAVGMYDGSPNLRTVPSIDPTEARDTLQYMDAFRPVILLLESQVRHLKLQFKVRKLRATESSLLVYQHAKTVQRSTPGADLDANLGTLKQQLGRRKKVKAAKPAKTPAPSSTPTGPAPADPAKTGK